MRAPRRAPSLRGATAHDPLPARVDPDGPCRPPASPVSAPVELIGGRRSQDQQGDDEADVCRRAEQRACRRRVPAQPARGRRPPAGPPSVGMTPVRNYGFRTSSGLFLDPLLGLFAGRPRPEPAVQPFQFLLCDGPRCRRGQEFSADVCQQVLEVRGLLLLVGIHDVASLPSNEARVGPLRLARGFVIYALPFLRPAAARSAGGIEAGSARDPATAPSAAWVTPVLRSARAPAGSGRSPGTSASGRCPH
jgi:hypothetical protein